MTQSNIVDFTTLSDEYTNVVVEVVAIAKKHFNNKTLTEMIVPYTKPICVYRRNVTAKILKGGPRIARMTDMMADVYSVLEISLHNPKDMFDYAPYANSIVFSTTMRTGKLHPAQELTVRGMFNMTQYLNS